MRPPVSADASRSYHSNFEPSRSDGCRQPDEQHDLKSQPKAQNKSHGLGDFGSLWDVINGNPDSFRNGKEEDTTVFIPSNHHVHSRSSVTILKRPSQIDRPETKTSPELRTSSKPIPVPGILKPKFASKAGPDPASNLSSHDHGSGRLCLSKNVIIEQSEVRKPVPVTSPKPVRVARSSTGASKAKKLNVSGNSKHKEKIDMISSESSVELDSDSNTTIFDRPLARKPDHLAFVPGQVGTVDLQYDRYGTPPSSFDDAEPTINPKNIKSVITTSTGIRVLPIDYKTATERRIGLMTKLLREFPEYARLVSQVGQSPKNTREDLQSRPIHVFVDMSNIMVGFHDSVKVSRDIPISTRIRRLHMSFANFSLIMERGRCATKRVLVGSDRLPSIEEAKGLGYEANILERVNKTKHATSRSLKPRKAPGHASQLDSSGPETVSAFNQRWVEQGVDEILHLKILESLLDTDEPATIVLATGDAAAAEYSEGFMRMVERALQRGWSVELVSFSQVTSYSYRKKDFRTKWGDRFRLVELDSYVEELFE
ncbi:hypothetical protein VI817_005255 [Penicillium citrinum]|nr:hypothetical protein VI817_005255 [Penicillium citrinum]